MKIYSNILPNDLNSKIIKILLNEPNWRFGKDYEKEIVSGVFDSAINHAGFSLISYDAVNNINIDSVLNIYADIILHFVVQAHELNKFTVQRFCWNYYMSGMQGNYHVDHDGDDRLSILYSLNTTDGGLYLGDKFYPDCEGEAKVFNSYLKHKGVGPQKHKARFNLNTILII
jgi:hypothetical protein